MVHPILVRMRARVLPDPKIINFNISTTNVELDVMAIGLLVQTLDLSIAGSNKISNATLRDGSGQLYHSHTDQKLVGDNCFLISTCFKLANSAWVSVGLIPKLCRHVIEKYKRIVDAVAERYGVVLKEKQLVAIMSGHDVFVTLPTGYGKSLIFALLPWVFLTRLRFKLYVQ